MKVNQEFLGRILSCPAAITTSGKPKTPRQAPLSTPRIGASSSTQPSGSHTPRSKSSKKDKPYVQSGPLLISNANERKELSFFNLLYTDMGFKNCQKFFYDESASTSCHRFTENQFINFMRELSGGTIGDHQIVEIFDILDTDDKGSIDFKAFFLMLSIVSAIESGQAKQFFYMHHETVYKVISSKGQADHLGWEEFCRFGVMMGMSEVEIYSRLAATLPQFDIFEKITPQEFTLYYYIIVEDLDKGRTSLPGGNVWERTQVPLSRKDGSKEEGCILS